MRFPIVSRDHLTHRLNEKKNNDLIRTSILGDSQPPPEHHDATPPDHQDVLQPLQIQQPPEEAVLPAQPNQQKPQQPNQAQHQDQDLVPIP